MVKWQRRAEMKVSGPEKLVDWRRKHMQMQTFNAESTFYSAVIAPVSFNCFMKVVNGPSNCNAPDQYQHRFIFHCLGCPVGFQTRPEFIQKRPIKKKNTQFKSKLPPISSSTLSLELI